MGERNFPRRPGNGTSIEDEPREPIPVPVYDPNTQVFSDLDDDWREHYQDPDLYTIARQRTRAHRMIDTARGSSLYSSCGGEGLPWAIEQVHHDAGGHFQAHGLSKGGIVSQLDQLLTTGIDPSRTLYSMGFHSQADAAGAFGAERPVTTGGLIVLSAVDQLLPDSGVKYVVLGEEYNNVTNLMRKKYPGVEFISWHEAPRRLAEIAAAATGQDFGALVVLTKENKPVYHHALSGRWAELDSENPPPVVQALDEGDLDDDVW